jgi:hypothetical protein
MNGKQKTRQTCKIYNVLGDVIAYAEFTLLLFLLYMELKNIQIAYV